jgi:hypothetical protein
MRMEGGRSALFLIRIRKFAVDYNACRASI